MEEDDRHQPCREADPPAGHELDEEPPGRELTLEAEDLTPEEDGYGYGV